MPPAHHASSQLFDAAMERVARHEDVCALRYEAINNSLGEINAKLTAHDGKFERLDKAAWSVVGTVGLLALSLIAFLFLRVWPPASSPDPHERPAVSSRPLG